MTSLSYGIDMPYEVQLEHAATPTTHMTILESQRSPGYTSTRHHLTQGVYMVSLAYNGAQRATLQHVGGGTTNTVSVAEGDAGTPRSSAPMKISVQNNNEYLQVASTSSTGGSSRATISVIPASTFDEMEESAQGASVLSEISTLKTTKADKSALEATNYIKGSAEDLNALTSDNDFGMWRTAAGCLNTPGPGFYHVLVYGAAGTTHRIQKATRYGSQTVPSEHIRVLDTSAAGVWGPWERVDIRTDTRVGTRVYAGDTMIHGDTGWRDMREYLATGWTAASFRMRRTNFYISYQWFGLTRESGATNWMTISTPGFSPGIWCSVPLGTSTLNIESDGRINYPAATPPASALASAPIISSTWPATLPGLPA